jgi:kynurenine 3-monooxygenase
MISKSRHFILNIIAFTFVFFPHTTNSLILGESNKVVVVGGGPVGLATAITLSQGYGCDVTVVEQAPKTSGYDPVKAYLYLVNPRGQIWTKRFPRVQELLEERGTLNTGMGNFVVVPADPSKPIPDKIPAASGEASYWIPRHMMVDLLETVIQEQEENRLTSSKCIGSVQILPCKQCLSLTSLENGQIRVTVLDTVDPKVRFEQSFVADLVVGADGMNSAVRNFLSNPPPEADDDWLTQTPSKFRTHTWKSAASGLRMKVLQFPPAFKIGSTTTDSETIYAIRSVNTKPLNYISLGLLPVKDPTMVRPTNVITRKNHELWKLKDGMETKQWFQKAFPRLDFNSLIDDKEWERFSAALGTTFPNCQYCAGMQVTHPSGNSGVVLVGDAIHAFPPDIGQGINAGLADVEALDRALSGKDIVTGNEHKSEKKPKNLAQSLKAYHKARDPEIKALIRLSRFGSPYQYRQPLYRDKIGRTLWSLNVALRLLLNKISRGKIPPAAIMMAMDRTKTYRQVMINADMVSLFLWSVIGLSLHKIGGMIALYFGGSVSLALWMLTYWFGK